MQRRDDKQSHVPPAPISPWLHGNRFHSQGANLGTRITAAEHTEAPMFKMPTGVAAVVVAGLKMGAQLRPGSQSAGLDRQLDYVSAAWHRHGILNGEASR